MPDLPPLPSKWELTVISCTVQCGGTIIIMRALTLSKYAAGGMMVVCGNRNAA